MGDEQHIYSCSGPASKNLACTNRIFSIKQKNITNIHARSINWGKVIVFVLPNGERIKQAEIIWTKKKHTLTHILESIKKVWER